MQSCLACSMTTALVLLKQKLLVNVFNFVQKDVNVLHTPQTCAATWRGGQKIFREVEDKLFKAKAKF